VFFLNAVCERPVPISLTRTRILLSIVGISFLVGLLFFTGFAFYLLKPAREGGPTQVFVVEEGMTLSQVAAALETQGLIGSRRLLLMWARPMGYGRHVKSGEYLLSASMPPLKILEILSAGKVMTHAVTIPEGFNREQIGQLLEGSGLADKAAFMSLTGDAATAKAYGIDGPGLEGYLFPDTYQFSRGMTARAIIDVMVKHFFSVMNPLMEAVSQSGMTLEEVMTLASIVEKETGVPQERPLIAGVFLNRLKRNMRLESDPTVIYGIAAFDGNLKKGDLNASTPYNTYLIKGLPPGPISNPGLEAIKAVLFPTRTDYLYFVSKNDGSHHFSKTLPEHEKAVRRYQKSIRNISRKPS
jgi:UPF0755 protein